MDLSSDMDHDKDYVGVVWPGIDLNLTLHSMTGSSTSLMGAST